MPKNVKLAFEMQTATSFIFVWCFGVWEGCKL